LRKAKTANRLGGLFLHLNFINEEKKKKLFIYKKKIKNNQFKNKKCFNIILFGFCKFSKNFFKTKLNLQRGLATPWPTKVVGSTKYNTFTFTFIICILSFLFTFCSLTGSFSCPTPLQQALLRLASPFGKIYSKANSKCKDQKTKQLEESHINSKMDQNEKLNRFIKKSINFCFKSF
jgi:hypothetical protein